MHLHVGDARTGLGGNHLVGFQHDFVNLALALVELAAYGRGTGKVGGIVVLRLGAGITYHQATFFQHVVVTMVVERLSVDAEDDRERHGAAARQ